MASSAAHHVTLMSECYEELVHSMMVGCSGNNTETLAMIRSYGVAPHYGFRLLSALQRTGELQLDINTSCDVFLAPGVPFNCWPMKHNQVDELIARSGNASQHQWDSKPLPSSIAMPRVLRSAASPFPNQFIYRPYAQNFVDGNFTASFEPDDTPSTFKWTQLVLGHNLKLVKDIGRLERGDPESPSISYFHYQFYAGGAGSGPGGARLPTYEAIVVGAIVRDNAGNWVSWRRGVPVDCPLFDSAAFRTSIPTLRLPAMANAVFETLPPEHFSRQALPVPHQGQRALPLPERHPRGSQPPADSHIVRLPPTNPEQTSRHHELSHRQRHIYQQDYARYA